MAFGYLAFDHLRYVLGDVALLEGMGIIPGFAHGVIDRSHNRAELGVACSPSSILLTAPIAFLAAITMGFVQLIVAIGMLLGVEENRRGKHRVGERDVLAKQTFDKGKLAMLGVVLREAQVDGARHVAKIVVMVLGEFRVGDAIG